MTNSRLRGQSRIRCGGLACLVAGACLAMIAAAQAQQAASATHSPPAGPIIPVAVAKIVRQDVPIWLRGLGTVQPFQAVQVRTRVDGTLLEVPVAEGQEVRKGDVLALIDPRPYRAQLDLAVARRKQDVAALENARADLARYTALAQREIASRQKLDTVTMQVNQFTAAIAADDAQIAAAELNLDFCQITAPFDARVGLRGVDPGNVVRAAEATPMFTLVQLRPIAATFTVPQDNLPTIQDAMARGAMPVVAFASDDRTELGGGTLLTVDNAIDIATGTIKLKAAFPNKDGRLWPGQFVNLRVLVGADRGVLTVPTSAVTKGQSNLYVYIVKPDSTVVRQEVEMSRDDGQQAVITKGLEDGQTVVVDGQSRLRSGSRVAAGGQQRPSPQQDAKSGS